MINKQMARQYLSTVLGKAVKKAARLRGGGSALPGLVVERLDPGFLKRTLNQLPMGVLIISGTNGKTTTTKIVVELLESAGLKVFTNRTGSNFSRGVVAALLGEIDMRGRLKADIAVLELDEAWAAKFVQQVPPKYSLLLNVLRDQLDRFGEIDTTAKLLGKIAEATTGAVTLNRDDPRIFALNDQTGAEARFFGTTTELLSLMPTDDGLKSGGEEANEAIEADVLLESINPDGSATFKIDGTSHTTSLALAGVYNIFNAAAALTMVSHILRSNERQVSTEQLIDALSSVRPAFGRGEVIEVRGVPVELLLVKNPSGFRLALLSFIDPRPTMIAINDNYADGRDMSWLWDVDFEAFIKTGVEMVSGIRAYDMALRLDHDKIAVQSIKTSNVKALHQFLGLSPDKPKRIYCTYTAMLTIRRELAKIAKVEAVE